ncbi:hypothetical protein RCO28_05500 [Streptomyces sp. LHD-70]|uniref:hypothetical protein n=1 Tax=Streptomyces sp. LHD-70 TaxID=3072140 RepID=UPI0028103C97|nr:hypothetical protein [Streptomyces sp. LHD-70]MDQ8701945.1 hypothetical protein [Streptomyces sp. LHD-70]
MYDYEMQRMRSDELIAEAEAHRLVAEVRAAVREGRSRRSGRRSGSRDPEGRVNEPPRRFRFTRAA